MTTERFVPPETPRECPVCQLWKLRGDQERVVLTDPDGTETEHHPECVFARQAGRC